MELFLISLTILLVDKSKSQKKQPATADCFF